MAMSVDIFCQWRERQGIRCVSKVKREGERKKSRGVRSLPPLLSPLSSERRIKCKRGAERETLDNGNYFPFSAVTAQPTD